MGNLIDVLWLNDLINLWFCYITCLCSDLINWWFDFFVTVKRFDESMIKELTWWYDDLIIRWYRVSTKKVLHKSEEKMHKKMKMTSQRAENLVHVQQHHGKCLYKKLSF